jgi:hypothetical protein
MSLRERTRPGPAVIVARNLARKPPISGAQLRAARALLKLSFRELSDRCGVSQSAIARSEQVDGTPPMRLGIVEPCLPSPAKAPPSGPG